MIHYMMSRDTFIEIKVSLHTRVKFQSQPMCPSVDEWVKKNGILTLWSFINQKKKKKNVICKKRDRNGYLRDTNQTQKTNIKCFFSYTEFWDESQDGKQELLGIYQNMKKKGERQASREDEYHQSMFMMHAWEWHSRILYN